MHRTSRIFTVVGLAFALSAVILPARAEDSSSGNAAAAAAVAPPPDTAAAKSSDAPAAAAAGTIPDGAAADNASQYCRNIANAAADARYQRQVEALTGLEKDVDDRIAKLEAKRAEFEEWVKRRQDFLDKADAAVVAIYSQMRPDAAALQIAIMEPESAAAILAKLNPRIASAILDEMDAATAARLTNVMAGLPPAKSGGTSG